MYREEEFYLLSGSRYNFLCLKITRTDEKTNFILKMHNGLVYIIVLS